MDLPWMHGFEDFGSDALMPISSGPTLIRLEPENSQTLRQMVGQFAPKLPGVYGMLDATGRLVYVGKSKALRSRLLSYFMPNNSDEKAGRIIECATAIAIEQQPSEFAALVREQSLIRRWQPRFNVVGMPRRQQTAFLCLGNGPAEQIFVSKWMDPNASTCRGPFHGAGNLHRAAEILNRFYLLRDCSPKTPMLMTNQLQLFPLESRAGCVRQEIGNCLAPCQSQCARGSYERQTELAKQFLDGQSDGILEQLESTMKRAAQGLHFEHALRLREDMRIIKWLTNRLKTLKRAREGAPYIYPVAGCDGRNLWYLIRRGGVELAIVAPTTSSEWKKSRSAIDRWLNQSDTVGAGYLPTEDTIGLVSAWFQKNKNELHSTRSASDLPENWKAAKDQWLRAESAPVQQSA